MANWSTGVQHGDEGGYAKHRREGSEVCGPCLEGQRAKAKAYRQKPENRRRAIQRARAQALAYGELARMFKREYDILYRGYLNQLRRRDG